MAKRSRKRTGLVLLNRSAVLLRMVEENISPMRLRGQDTLFVSGETWQRILDEKEIRFDSAFDVAKGLNVSLRTLMHPRSLLELTEGVRSMEPGPGLPDWHMDEPCRYGEASNGLKYWIWKLKHRVERERYARGKRYNVEQLRTSEQQRAADYLARHGDVCNRVQGESQFPRHITTTIDPQDKVWWSVDEWTPGKTLADVIYHEGIPRKAAPSMMRNVAKGLKALHEVGVIYRELTTQSIIVVDVDQSSVVLTDFELGKMLDGSPTVRGSRSGNPYQALEVDGKTLTKDDTHVDWYSWARILIHVVTDGLPPKNQEGPCLEQAELPDRVKKIVAKCLSPDPLVRPREANEVLGGIRWWR